MVPLGIRDSLKDSSRDSWQIPLKITLEASLRDPLIVLLRGAFRHSLSYAIRDVLGDSFRNT